MSQRVQADSGGFVSPGEAVAHPQNFRKGQLHEWAKEEVSYAFVTCLQFYGIKNLFFVVVFFKVKQKRKRGRRL